MRGPDYTGLLVLLACLFAAGALCAQTLPGPPPPKEIPPPVQEEEVYRSPLGYPRGEPLRQEMRCWWVGKTWSCR